MDFFKSVFSDDQEQQTDLQKTDGSVSETHKESTNEKLDQEEKTPLNETDSSPESSGGDGGGLWSFGGLIKNFASKSESVIQTYRRDLEEFGTGLRNESFAIREAASRAVKELPGSIEVHASAAQESLGSVGHVIDEFGSSVWRGTSEIITQGKDAFLSGDNEIDSVENSNQQFRNSKRYNRFEAHVNSIQNDASTYCEEPDDLDEFRKWKLGFDLEEKLDEMENLLDDNEVMEGLYTKLVPGSVDHETFWDRYFYKLYKLKLVEDARANLVKRVISEEEEDLSWDVDDDESAGVEEEMEKKEMVESVIEKKELVEPAMEKKETVEPEMEKKEMVEPEMEKKEMVEPEMEKKEMVEPAMEKKEMVESVMEKKPIEESQVESSSEVADKKVEDITEKELVVGTSGGNGSDQKNLLEGKDDSVESKSKKSVTESNDNVSVEGKTEPSESCKDSEISVNPSQPPLPEEEDLGWDEIEDLGSHDDKKVTARGSPNRDELRKRLSAAEEDEDLSWDIEDDDEPVKH